MNDIGARVCVMGQMRRVCYSVTGSTIYCFIPFGMPGAAIMTRCCSSCCIFQAAVQPPSTGSIAPVM